MVYAEFGGQTECIMGNWKIENNPSSTTATAFLHGTTISSGLSSDEKSFIEVLNFYHAIRNQLS